MSGGCCPCCPRTALSLAECPDRGAGCPCRAPRDAHLDAPSTDQWCTRSRWTKADRAVLLLYRLPLLVFFVLWLVRKLVLSSTDRLAYLTQQSWIVLILYQTAATLLSVHRLCTTRQQSPLWVRAVRGVCWSLQVVGWAAAVAVTVGYWLIIFPRRGSNSLVSGFTADNFIFHAVNLIFVLLETVLISLPPVRLAHVWLPALYGTWYSAFTVVYWAAGGTGKGDKPYIYPPLDYGADFGRALGRALLLGWLLLPLCHLLQWLGYRGYVRWRHGRWFPAQHHRYDPAAQLALDSSALSADTTAHSALPV